MEKKEPVLYSTHCPMCMAAESLLRKKGIRYTECDDVEKMIAMGITHAPLLDMGDGKLLSYKEMMSLPNCRL